MIFGTMIANNGATGNMTVCTMPLPANSRVGYVALWVQGVNSGTSTPSPPAGSTLLQTLNNGATNNNVGYLYVKTLTATDITNGSLASPFSLTAKPTAAGVILKFVTAANIASSQSAIATSTAVTNPYDYGDVLVFATMRHTVTPVTPTVSGSFAVNATSAFNFNGVSVGTMVGHATTGNSKGDSVGSSTVASSSASSFNTFVVAVPRFAPKPVYAS